MTNMTKIIRDHYLTGKYRNCHFRMTAKSMAILKEASPEPASDGWTPSYPHLLGMLGSISGIPIQVNEMVPPGQWQLWLDASFGIIAELGDKVSVCIAEGSIDEAS